eukprot:TRINITY_DN4909_c0_g1_i1.p1 TRINITY_DN4909_c0_g1~~TRINITY_DN4909_c0_g1_i1.p1  ORF type:complete len:363 (-),score=52.09 TRINITY_DN4909_c0_g1_i1:30-1118(-)
MDPRIPIRLVTLIYTVINRSKQIKANVKSNRRKCDELMLQLTTIENLLKQKENEILAHEESYLTVLQDIYETVNEVADFILSHTKGNAINRMFKGRQYEETFTRLSDRMNECLELLALTIQSQTQDRLHQYSAISSRIQSDPTYVPRLHALDAPDTTRVESVSHPEEDLNRRMEGYRARIAEMKHRLDIAADEAEEDRLIQQLVDLQKEMLETQKRYLAMSSPSDPIPPLNPVPPTPSDIDPDTWNALPADIRREYLQERSASDRSSASSVSSVSSVSSDAKKRYAEHMQSEVYQFGSQIRSNPERDIPRYASYRTTEYIAQPPVVYAPVIYAPLSVTHPVYTEEYRGEYTDVYRTVTRRYY